MTNTNTASGAAELATRLRNACASVRNKSYPLADLIPLMQQAADALASAAAPAEQPDTAYAALPDDRESFKAYLKECDECAIVPDVAGAFNAAWHIASRGQAYPTIEDLCARIKAADDAAADNDYMLDSNDCIAGLRGDWNRPLAMDKPDRASRGQTPAGWAIVPADATDTMMAAFAKAAAADIDWHGATEVERQEVRDGFGPAYRAMLAAAPQPPITPQADSQPAPVLEGERDLDAWKCERCHGKGLHWQSESVNHGKEIGVENVDLKTHCDACEGTGWCGPDADRAARSQADSVTAPAGGAVAGPVAWPTTCDGKEQEAWEAWAQTELYDMTQHPLHYLFLNERTYAARQGWKAGLLYAVEQMKAASPTPPTQAADSVLEDAERLDWLALAGPTSICVVVDRRHDGEVEVATDDVTGYGKTLREALDAARKQGGAA